MAAAAPARAADIEDARYDAATDELVVEIDAQGNDKAREEYRVSERISLEDLPCRPAIVTLRLGRVAHADVYAPKLIELAP